VSNEETQKGKVIRLMQVFMPLVGASIALISLLLANAARKKELTCTLTSSTRLVSENLGGIHPDLHVEFRDQPLTSLSKLNFSLRNTGAAAIKGSDVIEPIRLEFPAGTKLLSATVDRTLPQQFNFSASTSPNDRDVVLGFSLLNAGDEAQFSVYVLNSSLQQPVFIGRIVDVAQMVYSDAVGGDLNTTSVVVPRIRSHPVRSLLRWTLSIVFLVISGFFVGLWISGVISYVRYLPWRWKFKTQYDEVFKEAVQRRHEERRKLLNDAGALIKDPVLLKELEIEQHFMIDEVVMHEGTPVRMSSIPGLSEDLRKKGIPEHPRPMIETTWGIAAFSVSLLSVASLFALTSLIVYQALRS
jgi:hypothetical protein